MKKFTRGAQLIGQRKPFELQPVAATLVCMDRSGVWRGDACCDLDLRFRPKDERMMIQLLWDARPGQAT